VIIIKLITPVITLCLPLLYNLSDIGLQAAVQKLPRLSLYVVALY